MKRTNEGPRFVGRDQYGQTYWIEKHPRKELMQKLNLIWRRYFRVNQKFIVKYK